MTQILFGQATTSTSSTFSSVYAKNEDDSGGLTKKYADCAVQLEERSRSKAVRAHRDLFEFPRQSILPLHAGAAPRAILPVSGRVW